MAKNGKPGRSEDVDKTPLEDVSQDTVNSYSILLCTFLWQNKHYHLLDFSQIFLTFADDPEVLKDVPEDHCRLPLHCLLHLHMIVDHHFPPFSPQANQNPASRQVPESKRPGSFHGGLVPDRSHRVRDHEACLCAYLFAGITLTIDNHNLEHQKFQNFTTCP